ncbi:MAG: hypothetical protein HUU34_09240 [Saprospiraceae bacterium]|jgi:hypothetical protein|nr:hypothetical protein [Saprospiraceae bacterium]
MKKSKFTKTQNIERRRQEKRYFSEEARKAIVAEIESGQLSKAPLCAILPIIRTFLPR